MKILTFQDALTGQTILVKVDASGISLCKEYDGSGYPAAALGVDGDSYKDTDNGHLFARLNGVWSRVTVPDPYADSLANLRDDFRRLLHACYLNDMVLPDTLDEELAASST